MDAPLISDGVSGIGVVALAGAGGAFAGCFFVLAGGAGAGGAGAGACFSVFAGCFFVRAGGAGAGGAGAGACFSVFAGVSSFFAGAGGTGAGAGGAPGGAVGAVAVGARVAFLIALSKLVAPVGVEEDLLRSWRNFSFASSFFSRCRFSRFLFPPLFGTTTL